MGYEVAKSGTDPLVFQMVSTSDGVTPVTGLSPTVQVSKHGGSLGSAGAVSEIGGGWYAVAKSGTYGAVDSPGPLLLVATAAGARGSDVYPMVDSITDRVWDASMMQTWTDETFGVAFANAFRGYHLTLAPGGHQAAGSVPEGTVGLVLAPDGLDQVVVETGVNARQSLSLIGAATAGKASGLATTTATFYAMGLSGTTTARIVAGTDASGNRMTTTLTPPA